MTEPFIYRRSGICGHEILDSDGSVIAWTVDAGWAGIITGLLNKAAPFQADHTEIMTMNKNEIKQLVQMLLKHRPDLVIVKTDSEQEKMTLVDLQGNEIMKFSICNNFYFLIYFVYSLTGLSKVARCPDNPLLALLGQTFPICPRHYVVFLRRPGMPMERPK